MAGIRRHSADIRIVPCIVFSGAEAFKNAEEAAADLFLASTSALQNPCCLGSRAEKASWKSSGRGNNRPSQKLQRTSGRDLIGRVTDSSLTEHVLFIPLAAVNVSGAFFSLFFPGRRPLNTTFFRSQQQRRHRLRLWWELIKQSSVAHRIEKGLGCFHGSTCAN